MQAQVIEDIETLQPQADPYEEILVRYVEEWVVDLERALLDDKSRLYRAHRQRALALAILGMLGEYQDLLLSTAANTLRITPVEMWLRIYKTALERARRSSHAAASSAA